MLRILVPLALGVAAVLQGGMNRRVGAALGVPKATLVNNIVLLGASVVLYLLTRPMGNSGVEAKSPSPTSLIIPGLLGMCLVAGIPWAISKWGATIVFVGLIFSQLTASLVWDMTMEQKEVSIFQVLGVLTSMAGAILVNFKG